MLVYSYYMNNTEINLQNMYHNVYLYNVFTSNVIIMQMIKKVKKLKQLQIVKIYKYIVFDTFNMRQLFNNVNKMIFTLVIKLNQKLINMFFNKKINMIDFDY